jgi:hypothetical protein
MDVQHNSGGFFMLMGSLCVGFVALCAFAFWLWMLIDVIQNERLNGNEKLAWLLVVFFTNGLGALIYFFLVRSKRN